MPLLWAAVGDPLMGPTRQGWSALLEAVVILLRVRHGWALFEIRSWINVDPRGTTTALASKAPAKARKTSPAAALGTQRTKGGPSR